MNCFFIIGHKMVDLPSSPSILRLSVDEKRPGYFFRVLATFFAEREQDAAERLAAALRA